MLKGFCLLPMTCAIVIALCCAQTEAQTISWNSAVLSGAWNVPQNWVPQMVPQSGVSAGLVQGDDEDRTVTFIAATPTSLNAVNVDAIGTGRMKLVQSQDTLGAATFSLGLGGVGLYQLSGGTLSATAVTVGGSGAGTITQSAGMNQSTGFLSIGDGAAGAGTYLLSGSGTVYVPQIYLGFAGAGTFVMSGGQISGPANSFISIGNNATANGTLSISAGTISSQLIVAGASGRGTVNQTGGFIDEPGGFISIGDSVGGRGAWTKSAGTINVGELDVGFSGLGTFTHSGGVATISSILAIGANPTAAGTFSISGGTLLATATSVGSNGTISFQHGSLDTGTLSVAGGGRVLLTSGGDKTLVARSIALNESATIDLNDCDMLVHGGSSLTAIANYIRTARHSGAWDLPGITSSAAAATPSHATTLGAITGLQFHSVYGPSGRFNGLSVADDDVLVKYTWYGDTDFNGKVDGADYARTDTTFNNQLTQGNIGGWFNGDFDLNGKVDGADYALIDAAFNSQGIVVLRGMTVPEPVTILPAALIAISRRRRR